MKKIFNVPMAHTFLAPYRPRVIKNLFARETHICDQFKLFWLIKNQSANAKKCDRWGEALSLFLRFCNFFISMPRLWGTAAINAFISLQCWANGPGFDLIACIPSLSLSFFLSSCLCFSKHKNIALAILSQPYFFYF